MDEIDEAKRNIMIKGVINMIQDINILYHGTGATFENPDLDNSRETLILELASIQLKIKKWQKNGHHPKENLQLIHIHLIELVI